MTKKLLNRLLFISALAGLLVSGYLLEKYLFGGPILCGKSGDCDTVRASAYSHFFGIPLPVFGLIYYLVFLVVIILNTLYIIHNTLYKMLIIFLSIIGVLISVILFYIEVSIIHAICLWCTVSGVATVILLGISLFYEKSS